MEHPSNVHLASLLSWGLITQEEHDAGHTPAHRERLSQEESDEGMLFRMLVRGVVQEDDLVRRIAVLKEADPGDGSFDEPLGILTTVHEALGEAVSQVNKPHMDSLLRLGLIDEGQHADGCKVRPMQAEGRIDTPGRALMVLVNRGIVSEASFEALQASAREQASNGTPPSEKNTTVLEAARLYHEVVGVFVKAMASGPLKLFGGFMLALVLFVVLVLWLRS